MAQDRAAVTSLEIERVRPKVPVLYEIRDKFYAIMAKKEGEKISKRDQRVPLKARPGIRFGHFSPDGGDMGRGEGPSFTHAVVGTVDLKGGVEWTHLSDLVTDDNRKAVLKSVRDTIASAIKEFRRHLDSLCMTDGFGVVGVATSRTTAGGKDTFTLTTDNFGASLIRPGAYYSVYPTALNAQRTITPSSGALDNGAAQIEFVDVANKQVRMKGTVTGFTGGDKLVVGGLTGDISASPQSILGVAYHHNNASTGTWLGVDRANFPEVRANRVNAGGALALTHARLAINKIGDRIELEGKPKLRAWLHPCQAQALEELGQLVTVINKKASEEGLNLYFGEDMQLAGAPVVKHYSWDKSRIDFIMEDTWSRTSLKDPGWYTVNGQTIFPLYGTSGGLAAACGSWLTANIQTYMDCPPCGTYVDGLLVPSGY